MGNKSSISGIAIVLDKPSYLPGEIVSGLVHIDVKNSIGCHGVEIRYNLEENLEYNSLIKNIPKFNRNMQDQSFVILKCQNKLKSGQYSIPFSFKLSENTTGTFEFYNQNLSCFIKHSLTAFVVLTDKEMPEVSTSILLIVKENLNIEYPVIVRKEDTKKIKNWFFNDKGKCILSANYLNKTYKPKEEINLEVEIDSSNCKAKTSKLRIRLFQELEFKYLELKETINTLCNELMIDDCCVN